MEQNTCGHLQSPQNKQEQRQICPAPDIACNYRDIDPVAENRDTCRYSGNQKKKAARIAETLYETSQDVDVFFRLVFVHQA